MTDPQPDPAPEPQGGDLIRELKNEFATQVAELKSELSKVSEEKDAVIARQAGEIADLKRSLVRDAVINGPDAPREKTPEELYDETIEKLAKKTLDYMKS